MTFVLEAVGVRHGDAVILDGISVTLRSGHCTAIAGPSGAGKSTLLRLLNRMLEPTSGRVLLDGTPLPALDVLALRRRVGLVAQQPTLLTDTVLDDLRVGRPGLTEDEARSLLAETGLPPAFAERPTAGLSGGEAQRVCLARTLALRPEVLLLDEPTSALDRASAAAIEQVVKDLRAAGGTAVLVSHDTAQARRLADDVIVLRAGRLAEHGPPDEVAYLRTATS
ncbi:ABC transporter ATP-binding protein [Actinoallomurus rhizosphaericola]|uniref:ABC transporter ATP-binding protein n=1 Tax=Actinoallomurus rhizosphaericola TaxID=2952536 RepID=UPI0020920606|nr:ATP-binding cassette domain-containing protein [Actinoallomurus rhizosphaericola]MCO5996481.1 phosphate ABC transporter ATP-binding protein [Actinoallomurus rhizosphaericola]